MRKEIVFDKRAQGFEMGTLLSIAIVVILLVVIAYFIMNGSTIWTDWIGGANKPNVGAVAFNCNNVKCQAKDPSYCNVAEDVIFEKGGKKEKFTCKQLEAIPASGVTPCGNINCDVEIVSCAGLSVFCQGIDKCSFAWTDQATWSTYKNNTGAGKQYKEVTDSTGRVTDAADKTANTGKSCLKIVQN